MTAASASPHPPILIVEDNEDIRFGLAELLHVRGFRTTIAENGAGAAQWG